MVIVLIQQRIGYRIMCSIHFVYSEMRQRRLKFKLSLSESLKMFNIERHYLYCYFFVNLQLLQKNPLTNSVLKADIGQILRKLCEHKGIEIIEANACPDHIHMLVSIPPKYSVSQIMGYLKGKSSLMIFDRHANLKYKYGNRQFWCKGYYVDTVGRNKKAIAEYIRNQLQEDIASDQITLKEYIDPFTGDKNTKA